MPERLSVAIVTFDPDAGLLRGTLRSLATSALLARERGLLSSIELCVVDNGPDGARPRIDAALTEWPAPLGPATRLEGHGNVGFGRANNLALARADSDFHLVLNPDVELEAEALSAALAALGEHADVGLVAPAVFDDHGERQYLCKRYPTVWVLFLRGFAPAFLRQRFAHALADYEMRDAIADRFVKGIALASGCFMLLRTPLLRRLGGFDPRFFMYFEDYDLSLRAGREAAIAYVPQARVVHHGGNAARKGWRHVAWFVSSAARFFSRHGWRLA